MEGAEVTGNPGPGTKHDIRIRGPWRRSIMSEEAISSFGTLASKEAMAQQFYPLTFLCVCVGAGPFFGLNSCPILCQHFPFVGKLQVQQPLQFLWWVVLEVLTRACKTGAHLLTGVGGAGGDRKSPKDAEWHQHGAYFSSTPVAVINCPCNKKLRRKKEYYSSLLQITVHLCQEATSAEAWARQLFVSNPQSRTETNACMHACLCWAHSLYLYSTGSPP